jgi:hypothetical protein
MKYDKDIFPKVFSPQHMPSEEAQKEALACLNNEKALYDLYAGHQWVVLLCLDKINAKPMEPEITKKISSTEVAQILRSQGIDPDTGKKATTDDAALFEEKWEKRYGNIPR